MLVRTVSCLSMRALVSLRSRRKFSERLTLSNVLTWASAFSSLTVEPGLKTTWLSPALTETLIDRVLPAESTILT